MWKHTAVITLLAFFLSSCQHEEHQQVSEQGISGQQYLQSVQKTVKNTTDQVSPGIAFIELTMKKSSRGGNSFALNGLIIDEKGHIATLYFKESDVAEVKLWIGEEECDAKVVKSDRTNGVTFLKADTDIKTTPAVFADTSKMVNGQFLIGVSATSKNLAFEPVSFFGTLKAIIEGARDVVMVNGFNMEYSQDIPTIGMPLFNLEGEVVAVNQGRTIGLIDNVAKASRKFLRKKDEDLSDDEEPWIGLNYEAVSDELSKALKLPREAVRLTRVYEKSPAAEAGLKAGDLIVAIDGNNITRRGIRALSQVRKWLDPEIGRTCTLTVLDNGLRIDKELTFAKKFKVTSINIEEFGLTVNDISPYDHYTYSLKVKEGVLVTKIEGGSPAATSTYFGRPLIQRGDVITEVHGYPVKNIKDLRSALEKLRNQKISAVFIRMQRGNFPTAVSLNTAIGQKTKKKRG